jgi:hypothetical protein
MVIITRFNVNDKVFFWHPSGIFLEGRIHHILVTCKKEFTIKGIIKSFVKKFTSSDLDPEDAVNSNMVEKTEIFYFIGKEKFLEKRVFMDYKEAIDSIRIFR